MTVWLGPEREDGHKAHEMTRTISKHRENAKEWLMESLSSRKHSQEWHALHHMLQRSWW
jgi:hypothetical protein